MQLTASGFVSAAAGVPGASKPKAKPDETPKQRNIAKCLQPSQNCNRSPLAGIMTTIGLQSDRLARS
jgi:hypothetical protein